MQHTINYIISNCCLQELHLEQHVIHLLAESFYICQLESVILPWSVEFDKCETPCDCLFEVVVCQD